MRWRRDEQKGRIAAPISKGRLIFEKTENGASIQLPLADQTWFSVDRKDLTAREIELIDLLMNDSSAEQGHPWGRYFQGEVLFHKPWKSYRLFMLM